MVQHIIGVLVMKVLFIIIIVLLLAAVLVWAAFWIEHPSYRSKEFAPDKVKDISYDPETEILKFYGAESGDMYMARGSGTVWHSMSGRRLETLTEGMLADIYSYWKYNVKEKSDDRLGTGED